MVVNETINQNFPLIEKTIKCVDHLSIKNDRKKCVERFEVSSPIYKLNDPIYEQNDKNNNNNDNNNNKNDDSNNNKNDNDGKNNNNDNNNPKNDDDDGITTIPVKMFTKQNLNYVDEKMKCFETEFLLRHIKEKHKLIKNVKHLKQGLTHQLQFQFKEAFDCYIQHNKQEPEIYKDEHGREIKDELRSYILLSSLKLHLDLPIKYEMENRKFLAKLFDGRNIQHFRGYNILLHSNYENDDDFEFLNLCPLGNFLDNSEYYFILSITMYLYGFYTQMDGSPKDAPYYFKLALHYIETSIECTPTKDCYFTYNHFRALILKQMNLSHVAKTLLVDMVQRDGCRKAHAYLLLGHLEEQNLMTQKKVYEQGMKENPQFHLFPFYLGKIYKERSDYSKALEWFTECLSFDDGPEILQEIAQLSIKTRDYDAAEMFLEKLMVSEDIFDWEIYFSMGDMYQTLESYENAAQSYLKAVEIEQLNVELYNKLAFLYQNHLEDYGQAVFYLKRVLQLLGDRDSELIAKANYALGVLHQTQFNMPNEAKHYYEVAIMHKNDYFEVYYALGYLYQEAFHDLHKAWGYYKLTIQFNPEFAEAHYAMGLVYQEGELLECARESYKLTIKHKPTHTSGHLALGLLYSEYFQDYETCRDHYEAAIKLVKHADLHYAYGLLLQNYLNDKFEAKKQFEACLELNKNHVDVNYALGLLLKVNFNQFDAAKYYYERTIELDPDYVRAYQALGILLKTKFENFKEARKMYEKAIELDPRRSNSHYAYAILMYCNFDESKLGLKHFANSLTLEPSNDACWKYIKQLLYEDEKIYQNEDYDSWREFSDVVNSKEKFKEMFQDETDLDEKALNWNKLPKCYQERAKYLHGSVVDNMKTQLIERRQAVKGCVSNFFKVTDMNNMICEALCGDMVIQTDKAEANPLKMKLEQTHKQTSKSESYFDSSSMESVSIELFI